MKKENKKEGIIGWFVRNPVAANLLMVAIIGLGWYSAFDLRKQTTPDFDLNYVSVRVPYLGAAPEEVEEGVVIKIEEAIRDTKGIIKLKSTASEGVGSVRAEVEIGVDINEVLNEIKAKVDAISTFPELTEKPVVYKVEAPQGILFVSIYGDIDEYQRKNIAQDIKDELLNYPEIKSINMMGDRDFEISVEVTENTLREYDLTMSEVSQAIRASSIDLPGGRIRSEGGDILLRTKGQVYTGEEFGELVLRTYPDGSRLLLSDIAVIDDGFVESNSWGRFNGKPSLDMEILAAAAENEIETANRVKKYIKERSATLPDGVELEVWGDRSIYLQDRLDMMTKNMAQGALLVFIVLSLFLRMKVAFWAVIGIPISFFGALWLMPLGPFPVTINLISLFGFIMVLGIVVDDAIIIGESIYTKIRADGHNIENVIKGAQKVAVPATFGVLTTIAAFAPMLFVTGFGGPFFKAMSVVVILCLFFSIIESKLILPAHLAHARIDEIDEDVIFSPYASIPWYKRPARLFQRANRNVQNSLNYVIEYKYAPLIKKAVENRGLTAVSFLAALIVIMGVLNSGLTRFMIFPQVPGDYVVVELTMIDGSPAELRDNVINRIEAHALELNEEWLITHPGELPPINKLGAYTGGMTDLGTPTSGDGIGLLVAELPFNNREVTVLEVENMWRDRVEEMPGVKKLTFDSGRSIGGGSDLGFNIIGQDINQLEKSSKALQRKLKEYKGVFDIRSSLSVGGEEIKLDVKSNAETLGFSMASVGRQVRQAFYGEEAQRIQRGRNEIKVMVRYPEGDRKSIDNLESMRIRNDLGDEVPFSSVATASFGKAYSQIQREDGERVVTVSADVDAASVQPSAVTADIIDNFLPELKEEFPDLEFNLEGTSSETVKLLRELTTASIAALFLIYVLIAIPLRSYIQPIIIMAVIPFGLIGAVIGHIVFDEAISMFSLFGLVALAGVVVNDSIIMVDFINKEREEGIELIEAVVRSGTQRFRAITLTSLTTAIGLMPIMLETSTQAQFVIPMAISISFGIVFATVITLFLIPCLYVIQDDLVSKFKRTETLPEASVTYS
ncbi:efflux RND transporter permease subunit [Woeseiaceae bacterium]|nr:efflux RND transporter permease subunit [Woeseiaceae bacterium]